MSELGLRERQKRQVRASLERSALQLFAQRGFDATSVDDIAVDADVSRSTFFRYFGSKEAVVFSRVEERGKMLAEEILSRPPSETPLTAFMEGLIVSSRAGVATDENARDRDRIVQADPDLKARARELTLRWQSRIAETFAQRDGVEEPTPEHLLAASVGIAVTERIAEDWRSRPDADVEDLIRDQFELLRAIVG